MSSSLRLTDESMLRSLVPSGGLGQRLKEPSEQNLRFSSAIHSALNTSEPSRRSTKLSRRVVVDRADQPVVSDPMPDGPRSDIFLIRPTEIKHVVHGIEPVAAPPKSAKVVCGARRISIVRYARPIQPMKALVSSHDAFSKIYAEVEDNIQSAQLIGPGLQNPEKCLADLRGTSAGNETTAIAGTPSRDGAKPAVLEIHVDVEFGEEDSKSVQTLMPKLHEVFEILSAARRECLRFRVGQTPWTIWSLPMEWFVDRIIAEKLRNAMSLLCKLLRFSAQPVEHRPLHC
jgi:hypothetical protein